MPRAQLEQTQLYREWVRPQGILDSISAVLEKTSTSCAILALPQHASAGPVTNAMRERMRLVVPHVQRAVLIGKAFELRTVAAQDFAAAMDAVAAAIYLVDAEQHIVHANQSGRAVLAANDVLASVNGRLRAQDRAADLGLRNVLDAFSQGDCLAVGGRAGTLHMPSRSGEHYVAHALSLSNGGRRETARAHRATAVVFVHKATRDLLSPPAEVLARAYRLTPRELGVLLVIVESGSIANAARCLGLSQATVKTHLRQLFITTGTTRQTELIKLVAGFIGPAR
jgi:DNA-binding CsgD family transcriptional regulator